ncbi:unnamed protein product [Lactuca saligna]|uniref:Uncharacterized protein n=1 Tax=Lactuca saligna TaxID=75948 RepID=A0AA35ZSA3_LACSI|nr:unnamed protein product [Lactuca saligna]
MLSIPSCGATWQTRIGGSSVTSFCLISSLARGRLRRGCAPHTSDLRVGEGPTLTSDFVRLGSDQAKLVVSLTFPFLTFSLRGVEAEISLEMVLRGHYRGKLCHWEIDLLEALRPLVSKKRMREFAGFLSIEGGNTCSSGPTSHSRLAVGVVSPVHLPAPASFGLPVGSDEETESDDACLYPRKMHKTVSVAKLLGGIDDVLGDRFFVPGQKEKEVVPSSSMTPPFPFIGLLSIDIDSGSVLEGWEITRDSLLSKDINAQEWGSCAHPLATMKFLASQSSARMADDLLYLATQASALMVVVADRVFRADVNETQLKTFQGTMISIREELHDSEVERRVLLEQNCIMACKKVALEDHVATLEGQKE